MACRRKPPSTGVLCVGTPGKSLAHSRSNHSEPTVSPFLCKAYKSDFSRKNGRLCMFVYILYPSCRCRTCAVACRVHAMKQRQLAQHNILRHSPIDAIHNSHAMIHYTLINFLSTQKKIKLLHTAHASSRS